MKHVMMAAAVAATALLSACNSGSVRADLDTELDTLSYEMGLASSKNFMDVLTMQLGVDTAYVDQFLKGVKDGAMGADDKKKAAYFAGIQIGQQISMQMVPGTEMRIYGDDSTAHLSVKNTVAGFIAGVKGKTAIKVDGEVLTQDKAFERANARMESLHRRVLEEKYGDNKRESEEFMAAKAKEEGVKQLQEGVYYRVIEEGKGDIPSDTTRVLVRYEGRLVDGTVFDSTDKNNNSQPTRMIPVRSVPGFAAALTHMPVGSTWEVYIAPDMAYGERETSAIPPFSALTFKITLEDIVYKGKK